MWIIVLCWWKWPTRTKNALMAVLALFATCCAVAGAGRFYLRTTGRADLITMLTTAPPWLDVAGFFGGVVVSGVIAAVFLERADRRKAAR